jgi:UDP-glucose 4-epimerase
MNRSAALKGKRILVTGGCGYVGSHVVLALLDEGAEPVVLDDLSNGDRRLAPDGLPFVQGDCGDRAVLDEIRTRYAPSAVMHFAGKIIVPESVTDPLSYYEGNTIASHRLIRFAVETRAAMIFSSTAAVYGEPAQPGPIAEDWATVPSNPYGASKLMTEWMLRDAARAHGLRYAALRYFNVAGADPQGRAGQVGRQVTHLIKVAAQVALGMQRQLTVYGGDYPTPDGTCVRDYIHVTDLAAAHVKALERVLERGESFTANCGYGQGASVLDVVKGVERVLGKPLPFAIGPRRAGDPPMLVAQSDRIRDLLDWTPQHRSLDHIVATALAWERKWLAGRQD